MPPQPALHLPWGFRDAKTWLLVQAIIGEFFQGVRQASVVKALYSGQRQGQAVAEPERSWCGAL